MKKLLFSLLAMAFILASCSNSAGGAATGGLDGGTPTGGTPIGTGGDPTTNVPVLIGASNLMYIGEGQETVDSTAYTVKKYADVMVDNPYFYTYYKLYYLNGKLRRVYQFEHGIGCAMDYKYTEFAEHTCGGYTHKRIYSYYESGNLEYLSSQQTSANTITYTEQWYYNNPNKIKFMFTKNGNMASMITSYYSSGYVKCLIMPSVSGGTMYNFADNILQLNGSFTPSNYTDPSVYSSKEDLNEDQVAAKIAELKNN